MRAAIAAAEVADDVFGEDPTVHKLERKVAELLGKEAAMFVPSGTMSNQIGVRLHTSSGDELLCESSCHIFCYEVGGAAALSGVQCRTFQGTNGILELSQLEDQIHKDDVHLTPTRLVCLENTHNRGGGTIYPLAKIEAISMWARKHGLAMHLDGARLWNAIVASGIPGKEWAKHFDTVSVCFSKGLGAPVGSALCGPRDLITKARRFRKLYGGGMRQAGIIAAGALYAVEHHIDRLADDHKNAQILAEAVRSCAALKLAPEKVETNLVWFRIDPSLCTAQQLAQALREHGVLIHATGPHTMRACTHLDVDTAAITRAAESLVKTVRSMKT
jgi:threonine aldolase